MIKQPFTPPTITVVEVQVEIGFAGSLTNSKELPGFTENDNNTWE